MNFTFNKKEHRYELDGKPVTGVTTILGVIAKPALIQWAADEACRSLKSHIPDSRLFTVTKDEMDAWLEEARVAHRKKKEAAGEKGTDLHSEVEQYIKECMATHGGEPFTLNGDESPALTKFMNWAQENHVRFLASEKQVYSKEWWVAGTFDFSFEKDGKRYIGDLKTYGKIWDRVPHFQCSAYRKMSVEMGEPDYDGTCIVNINKETHKLTESWSYDWEGDEKAFVAALTLYRTLNN